MLIIGIVFAACILLMVSYAAPMAASATTPSSGKARVAPIPKIADGDIMLFGREIGTIAYADNAPRHYNVNQTPNMLKRFMLHVTVTATNNDIAPIPMPADGPFNMIENIQYKTSQGLVMKNFSALQIALLSNYETGTVAFNTAPATLAVGANAFSFDVHIPFEDWTNQYPERTALNTNSYNDSTLYATWADLDVAWPGWDKTRDNIIVDCRVVSYERQPLGKKDELLVRQQMIDNTARSDINAASQLLPENTNIKTLVVITRDSEGARADGMLVRIRVTFDSGSYVIRDMFASAIQSQNKSYYGVEQIATGVYVIEFDQTHDFKCLFNTTDRNFARIEFEAAAAQTGSIEVLRRRIDTPKIMTG